MRWPASRAQKDAWWDAYRTRLLGFVPCTDRVPDGMVHWGSITRPRHVNRLCDGVGDYPSAPREDVNCLTCLVRMSEMESIVTKETLNEKIERHLLNKLATLPKGRNAKLQELTNYLIHVAQVKEIPQAQVYDAAGRALIRLKKAGKARYVSGRGCGWRLP